MVLTARKFLSKVCMVLCMGLCMGGDRQKLSYRLQFVLVTLHTVCFTDAVDSVASICAGEPELQQSFT